MRANRLGVCLVLGLGVVSLAGCMLPGALAVADRLPPCPGTEGQRPCQVVAAADLVGSFESVEIRGSAAASVQQISYCFEADGRYSGEAVLLFADGPQTRKIIGNWKLVSGKLDLGHDSEPAVVQAEDHRLRFTTSLGTVILRRTD